MTEEDIVERLRTEAQEICADTYPRWKNADETMDEAANEIERLRAELNDASLEQAWAERNAAVAELVNYKEVSQARDEMMAAFIRKWVDVGPDNQEKMEDLERLELK